MRGTLVWRDLGVCLSLVNLLYLGVWRMTLALGVADTYYLPGPLSAAFFLRPVGVSIGLALVLLGLGRAARASRRAWVTTAARLVFLALALCALNAIRHLVPELSAGRAAAALGRPLLAVAAVFGAVLLVVGGTRWSRQAVRGVSTLLLVGLPFFPVTVAQAVTRAIAHRSLARERFAVRAHRAPTRPLPKDGARVVVVVFDEMDQRFLPPYAVKGVDLPAFEALRGTALWSERASAPADGTLESMPALLTGLRVTATQPVGPDELRLTLRGNQGAFRWSEQPGILTKVRSLGLESALVGWYHPYCRVLGADLTRCAWFAHVPHPEIDSSQDLVRQAILVGETVPGVARFSLPEKLGLPRPPVVSHGWHARQYAAIRREALAICGDPRYAFVFLHYPIPHKPFIWSRQSRQVDAATGHSYEDNLLLADRTLAELRATMESAGLWHDSTVIVTSDHGWREMGRPAPSVPFLLKTARQTRPLHYDRPLNTVVLADLAGESLTGRLAEPEAVVGWLDRRAARD